jgi:DNA uptake protein ComE-like DNA-binding protein
MEGPLKGMFEFSKRQQLGLLFFLSIIVSCLLVIQFHERLMPVPEGEISALDPAWLAYMDSLEVVQEESRNTFSDDGLAKKPLPEPFPFDPNAISLADFQALGFSLKQAESIDKFRSKGGQFRKVEDFKKMYVVDDFMYERLLPFIQIPEHPSSSFAKDSWDKKVYEKSDYQDFDKKEVEVLSLNLADSASLEGLPHIGPVYAQRILKYREKLGGFTSLTQLNEVYGFDKEPELIGRISPFLIIEGGALRKINVNKATWGEMMRHPYMTKPIANSIIAIREQHGPYKTVQDVSKSHLISEEVFLKLAPYLSVGN